MTTYEKEDSDEEGSFQVGVSVTEQVDDDNTTQLVCFGCASLLDEATDQQVSGGNTDKIRDTHTAGNQALLQYISCS